MRRHLVLKRLFQWQAALLIALALCVPASRVFADKFTLKDGTAVEGEILEEDGRSFFVQTDTGIANVSKEEIQKAIRDDGQPREFEIHILKKDAAPTSAPHPAPAAPQNPPDDASVAGRPTDAVGILKNVWFRSILFFVVLAVALTQIRRMRPK